MRETVEFALADSDRMREAVQAARLEAYDDMFAGHLLWVSRRDPKVYYGRLGDMIKIGTSATLKQRIAQYPPGFVLLATEPGGPDLEAQRHKQFARSRIGRSEWFQLTDDILAHIETLAATNAA